MSIFVRGKSKYVNSPLDGKDYNITTGHFKRYLASLSLTEEDFLVAHLGEIRPLCRVCHKPARLSLVSSVTSDLKWNWASTCGDKECAIEMRRRGRKAVTKDQEAESIHKRNKTFAEKPELLERRSRLAHEANLKVGEDGLTGYERTKKRREETLLKKCGRKDFANWEKTKETWKQKDAEKIKEHGDKIRSAWESKPNNVKRDEIARREITKLQKYGIPGWKIAFNGSKGRRSKIAEKFCESIQQQVNEPLIFGQTELNIQNNFFDLTIPSSRKIIEFNGDYWHANPQKYHSNETISLKGGRTAKEIWEADAKKIALAESCGYQVKVVWESDYKRNPQKIIEECLEWLKS